MKQLFRVYVKLLKRSRFSLFGLLGPVGLAALGPSAPHSTSSLSEYMNTWMPLTALGVMLAAIGVAGLDHRERMEELNASLPISNSSWLMGRLGTAALGAILVAVLQVTASGARGVALGGSILPPMLYFEALLAAAATLAVSAVIGFVFGLTSRSYVFPVLLSIVVWTSGLMGVGLLQMKFGYSERWLLLLALPIVDPNIQVFDSAGWFPHRQLVLFGRVFYFGVACAAAALSISLWKRTRLGGMTLRPVIGLALVALVLTGTGSAGYVMTIFTRDAEMEAERIALQIRAPIDPAPRLTVLQYDLILDLDLPDNELHAQASMYLSASDKAAREVVFSLRPGLKVSKVSGAELVEQSGQYVQLRLNKPLLPGASQTVTLWYSGQVMQWLPSQGSNLGILVNHLTLSSFLLAGNYGWYPLPGTESLARVVALDQGGNASMMISRDEPRTSSPALFRLEVRGADSLSVFSNLEEAGNGRFRGEASSVYLLGGRLEVVRQDGVEVLVPRDLVGQAKKLAGYYSRSLGVLSQLVPRREMSLPRFVIVPENLGFQDRFGTRPSALTPGAIFLSSRPVNRIAHREVQMLNLADHTLLSLWWPAYGSVRDIRKGDIAVTDAPAEMALGLLMADMHDQVVGGKPSRVLGTPPAPSAQLTESLRKLWYRDSGRAVNILRKLYALRQIRPLTVDDVMKEVEGAEGT